MVLTALMSLHVENDGLELILRAPAVTDALQFPMIHFRYLTVIGHSATPLLNPPIIISNHQYDQVSSMCRCLLAHMADKSIEVNKKCTIFAILLQTLLALPQRLLVLL